MTDRVVIELEREEAEALEGCWGFDPKSALAAGSAMYKLRAALSSGSVDTPSSSCKHGFLREDCAESGCHRLPESSGKSPESGEGEDWPDVTLCRYRGMTDAPPSRPYQQSMPAGHNQEARRYIPAPEGSEG